MGTEPFRSYVDVWWGMRTPWTIAVKRLALQRSLRSWPQLFSDAVACSVERRILT